jgi:general secretion pathway protein E
MMPNTTETPTPRRAFLASLLFAASAGCGSEGVTKNANVGQTRAKRTEVAGDAATGTGVPRLADIGMRPKILSGIRRLIAERRGMIVCCGPAGSGVTTTLYACLREIDRGRKIVTIEDPIEHRLDKITQKQIDAKGGQTFAGSFSSSLEEHPDVVMIGELRDRETAAIACQAALDRCLVLSGMHSTDTLIALFELLDLGIEPSLIASAVLALVGQRQVRLLCETCKEPYEPKPEFLKKANIPAEKVDVFYRTPLNPEPACRGCGGTGYVGLTGIFELLIVSEPIRKLLRNEPSLAAIKAEARKDGLIYLQEDGLRLVVLGQTSISELLRVVR